MCRLRYRLRLCQDASYFSSCKSLRVIVRYLNNSCCRRLNQISPRVSSRDWALLPRCCFINSSAPVWDLFFTRSKETQSCEMRRKWETFWFVRLWFIQACGSDFNIFTSSKVLQCKTTPTYSKACPFLVTLRIVHKWQRTKSFENVAWSELGKAKELFGMKGEYGQRQTILRIGVSF